MIRAFSYAGFTLSNTACRPLPNLCKGLLIYHTAITRSELACVKHFKYLLVFTQLLFPET